MANSVSARIHNLAIYNDRRQYIPLSTFGFYTGGKLQVNMTGFHLQETDMKLLTSEELVMGFSIDKTVSDATNPYVQATEKQCILKKQLADNEKAGILRFTLNFKTGYTDIKCSKNIRSITILDSPSKEAESVGPLSDQGLFRPKKPERRKRNLSEQDPDTFFENKLDKEIREHEEMEQENSKNPTDPKTVDTDNIEIIEGNEETGIDKKPKFSKSPEFVSAKAEKESGGNSQSDKSSTSKSPYISSTEIDTCSDLKIPLIKDDKTGYFSTSFVIYISDAKQEGLYSMFFHNCYNYIHRRGSRSSSIPVDFTIAIEEKNNDNYLSAGEMPLPALYQMLSILFFLSGCFWVFILKKNGSEQVFRIHWIMAALVFLKSLSLFFHGVNYNKIAANGIHMESWAILYYITHLLKGGLLFFTIVLIGSGWAFVKHILSSNEKKVFMVVLPLQVISNVAYIILEESEQGEAGRPIWKELFVLIDLVCCGAILLPVIWSIRHLQDASATDGKAAVSLEKLKLFRHFYIMVVCYVYFTRIIVYLLKITVPFQYEWLDSMFKEVATLVFFVMTGYKFRPASNNPYFAVPTDDDMEEVLIGSTAIMEQVTTRKSYKIESDEDEDDDENVVLFSKKDEISHDLD